MDTLGRTSVFGQYVRSSSFNLALSEAQISALIFMYQRGGDSFPHMVALPVRGALMSKGLAETHHENTNCTTLTCAGHQVCGLLEIAGYQIETDPIKTEEEQFQRDLKEENALQRLDKKSAEDLAKIKSTRLHEERI